MIQHEVDPVALIGRHGCPVAQIIVHHVGRTETDAAAGSPVFQLFPLLFGRFGFIQFVKQHHILGTAVLRRIAAIVVSVIGSRHGKPYLASPAIGRNLYFNISHTGGYLAFAMSTSTPLGIDIEKVDRNVRLQSLMGRFFHAEEIKKFLDYSDEERVKHFIHYWTLKESFVKGLGTGMTTSFTSFYLTKESERTFYVTPDKKELQDEYSSWRITSILAPKGFICSVAYRLS